MLQEISVSFLNCASVHFNKKYLDVIGIVAPINISGILCVTVGNKLYPGPLTGLLDCV